MLGRASPVPDKARIPEVHWTELAGKGKGFGAKGYEVSRIGKSTAAQVSPLSPVQQAFPRSMSEQAKGHGRQLAPFATQAANQGHEGMDSRGRRASPSAPVAPSLDELKTALHESYRELGPDHVVTRVVREEYEAAAHQRFCCAAPPSSQLEAAKAQLYWSERDMKLLKEAMAVTSDAPQRMLLERSRQITEEMELQEKMRWQRSEVSAISELLENERMKHGKPSSSASSMAKGPPGRWMAAASPPAGQVLGRPVEGRSRSPNKPGDGKGFEMTQRQRPANSGGAAMKKEQPAASQWGQH